MMRLRKNWHKFWLTRVNYKADTLRTLAKEDLSLAQIIFTAPKPLRNIKPKPQKNRTVVDYYSDVADILVAQPGLVNTLKDNADNVKASHISLVRAVILNEHNDSDERLESLLAIPGMLSEIAPSEIVTRLKTKSNEFIGRTWASVKQFFNPPNVNRVKLFDRTSFNGRNNTILHPRTLREATLESLIFTVTQSYDEPQLLQIFESEEFLKNKLNRALEHDVSFTRLMLNNPSWRNLLTPDGIKAGILHGIASDRDFAEYVESQGDLRDLPTPEELVSMVADNPDFKNKVLFDGKYAYFSSKILEHTHEIHADGLRNAGRDEFFAAVKNNAHNEEFQDILRDNDVLLLKLFECVSENMNDADLLLSDAQFEPVKNILLNRLTSELVYSAAENNKDFFERVLYEGSHDFIFESLNEKSVKDLANLHGIPYETKAEKIKRRALQTMEEFNQGTGECYYKEKFWQLFHDQGSVVFSDLDVTELGNLRQCFDNGSLYPNLFQETMSNIVTDFENASIAKNISNDLSVEAKILMMTFNACAILGLDVALIHDKQKIAAAYRSVVLAVHPDKANQSPEMLEAAQTRSAEITMAKSFLDSIHPYLTQSLLQALDDQARAISAPQQPNAFFNVQNAAPDKDKEDVVHPSAAMAGVD